MRPERGKPNKTRKRQEIEKRCKRPIIGNLIELSEIAVILVAMATGRAKRLHRFVQNSYSVVQRMHGVRKYCCFPMVWVTNWCRVYNGNVVNTVFVKKIDKKFFRFINVNICEINEVKCCARPVRLQCDDGSHFFFLQ